MPLGDQVLMHVRQQRLEYGEHGVLEEFLWAVLDVRFNDDPNNGPETVIWNVFESVEDRIDDGIGQIGNSVKLVAEGGSDVAQQMTASFEVCREEILHAFNWVATVGRVCVFRHGRRDTDCDAKDGLLLHFSEVVRFGEIGVPEQVNKDDTM